MGRDAPVSVAVIPARGGSQRIPRKNIRPFAGRPIIAYSIEAARSSGLFARVLVSTDDEEIAAVAREHGAEAPFLRPARLANDTIGTTPVVGHAVDWLEKAGVAVDLACCVYATAPFVRPSDLVEAHRLLGTHAYQYVFSATQYRFPVQRALRRYDDGTVEPLWPDRIAARSQDLEHAYHDAGQFYFGRAGAFKADLPIFARHSAAVLLPSYRVQDIDTTDDWSRAEIMYEVLRRHPER